MSRLVRVMTALAVGLAVAGLASQLSAGLEQWAPKVTGVSFVSPYNQDRGNTLLIIKGKDFTERSVVLIDGTEVESTLAYKNCLHVYFDGCGFAEPHTIQIRDWNGWGQRVHSKKYKTKFCMQ